MRNRECHKSVLISSLSGEIRNSVGMARLAVFLVEPDKLDTKRHLHGFLFIMHHPRILRRKERQTTENQTQFCSNFLT